MTRSRRIPGLDASAKIRLAFVVLSGLLAFQNDAVAEVLPWMLLVLVLDLTIVAIDSLVARPAVLNSMILVLLCCSAAAAGAGYALAGPGAALLILVPAYHAGSKYGRFGFLLACVVATGAYLVSYFLNPVKDSFTPQLIVWIGAAVTLGLLGAWNKRLADEQQQDVDPAAREAIELIQRLQDLSGQMSTGLDAPASASLALDLLSAEVPSTRSAVLVTQDAEHLVPVALRGSTRAPWHIAEHVADLLRTNPASWVPTEVTFNDDLGRRRALVVPFALGNGSTTVVVAERPDGKPFTDAERNIARNVTRRIAPTLQAGLLFGTLRQFASLEERNRIARDIHDGIAQELAALGYQVDALRAQAGPPGIPMRDGLDGLREQLSEAMADLRMHITDLRVAERPGTGLGAVLGAAVQSFGSVTGVRTTVTVSEGQRRMDPRVEILIHRLVMDILADAQACGARNAWVSLTTSVVGPACVDVSHDGDPRTSRRQFKDPALEGLDATLFVRTEPNGRTTVNLTVQEPTPVGAFRDQR
ncbi:MAG TPA: histidine kinase dimerization/phosphoacceptor domain-containing protein [Ornithinibacter sp.]|nr:histidine kinase dimerization/phosphoacceptor domain-containing protein [Ornithinibacter sp.]